MGFIKDTKNFLLGEMDDRGYAFSMRNRADFVSGAQRKLGMYNDPTYLGFVFLFQPNSPLLNTTKAVGSAYYYLNKIGETTRAQMVLLLAETIKNINHNMPWYWQSIEGLDVAYKFNKMKDPYRGGDDAKIVINTIESIDLTITQIIELYRYIIWDKENRREILPENLRKFRLWIWVQEMRKFKIDKSLMSKAKDLGINVPGADSTAATSYNKQLNKKGKETLAIVNENSPWLLFQLDLCEFDTDDSNPYLGSLSFAEATPASNKLTITYDNITYETGLNYGDLNARLKQKVDDEDSKFKDLLKDKVKDVATNAAVNAAAQIESAASGAVEGFATSLYLGNVYGLSPSNILDSIKQASISNAVGKLGNIF